VKILHLGIDSPFVDFLVGAFERHATGCNELTVISGAEPEARTGAFAGPRAWVPPVAGEVDRVRDRAAEADVVVVHAMSDFAALVCAELPPPTVLVWSGFGYDYYVGRTAAEMIGPATLRLVERRLGLVPDGNGRLVPPDQVDLLKPLAVDLVRQQAARRTDFLSLPVDADLAVFRQAYPGFTGQYRQLNYADLPSMCRAGDAVVTGQDVLVGNSSSWTNNHVEAFRILAESDLGDRRVVVPLTYGHPGYRNAVIKAGRRLLGEAFTPIVDHLPLADYLDVMAQCRVTLFQHRRQQGLGNIVAALHQGSHVYLDRRSPLFGWFRERGIDVGPARSLLTEVPSADVPPDTLTRHRAALAEVWGSDRVDANVRTFVGELERAVSASGRRARRPRAFPGRRRR
jgi:dTDP-N-acetylfucosamine:lipid II N-acetylfucosaminyltransferase